MYKKSKTQLNVIISLNDLKCQCTNFKIANKIKIAPESHAALKGSFPATLPPTKQPSSTAAAFVKSAQTITAGSKVKLKSGAKSYTGGSIASFVFNDTWIVLQVNGDRVVIDKNVSGKNSIMTPVNIKDLVLLT